MSPYLIIDEKEFSYVEEVIVGYLHDSRGHL